MGRMRYEQLGAILIEDEPTAFLATAFVVADSTSPVMT